MNKKQQEERRKQYELVLFYRDNPCIAARDLLNIDLAPHQRIALKAMWKCPSVILCLSRGTGKTFMLAIFCVLRAMLYPGEKIGIIGPTYRQSKFVFAEIEKIFERSPEFRAACSKQPTKTPESCYVKLVGSHNTPGSVIECLPLGDGTKIRGARYFVLVCDELAQIPSDILDIVVRGMMATSKNPMENVRRIEEQKKLVAEGKLDKVEKTSQNKIVYASTAYYQYNHFWQRVSRFQDELLAKVEEAKKYTKRGEKVPEELRVICRGHSPNHGQVKHKLMMDDERALVVFNYKDPPEGFMNEESIKEAQKDMTDYMFRMEYEAYFPADSDGFFPRSLLDKAREHRRFSCHFEGTSKDPKKVYLMGIDPARNNDNFVIAIVMVDLEEKTINLVRVLTYNKKPFPDMHNEIRRLIKLYNIAEIAMDAGGGGTTIRDLLANKDSCPMGEQLILQRDFDEHQFMKGRKILTLIQFSKYDWVHSANHNVLSGLQHGSFKIAASADCVEGRAVTPEMELADEEIEMTIDEIQNIVVTVTPAGRMHWDTPMKHHKKDRYSAVLIAHDLGNLYIDEIDKPIELATGFWS